MSAAATPPPRLARALLRLLAPRADRVFLLADLDEEFADRHATGSPRDARRWYRAQAARSIAPLLAIRLRLPRRPAPGLPKGSIAMRLLRDVRFAFRSLAVSRVHTIVAVLTLALGIGINAAVFSILDSILLRPLPFPAADRLVRLWNDQRPQGFTYEGFSPALVSAWRKQTDIVDRVEAAATASFVHEHANGASMVAGAYVTPELFVFLGARPLSGRLFAAGDGRTGSAMRAVVSEAFWRRDLASDRTAVGRWIRLNGEDFEIVGVVPSSFRYPTETQQIWVPYDVDQPPAELNAGARFAALARRGEGLTKEQLADRVQTRGPAAQTAAGNPPAPGAKGTLTARAVRLGATLDDRTERSIWVLAGAAGFLLLIVCANVASLTLSRALGRFRDLGVRTALGASRADLVRTALVEHAIIATIGGALGVVVAGLVVAATGAAMSSSITLRAFNVIDLDLRAIGFLTLATAAALLFVCLPPVLVASRAGVTGTLGRESRSATGSPTARRLRSGLVVVEVTLALVLLVGAALMTRSLLKLQAIDIGLDPDGLVVTQLALPQRGFADATARALFVEQLLATLRRTPGIDAVSSGDLPPQPRAATYGPIEFARRPGQVTEPALLGAFEVGPDYFQTTGIRIADGRAFTAGETGSVVVSESFAKQHWPGTSAVGERFRIGTRDWVTVAGVASTVRQRSEDADGNEAPIYYPTGGLEDPMRPLRPTSIIAGYQSVIVRTAHVAAAHEMVAQAVRRVDARVIVADSQLARDTFAESIARPRLVFLLMSVFSAAGLVLASAGIYSVLSCLVTQRLKEIGIRLALGASPGRVFRATIGGGMALTGAGVILGLALAAMLVRVMRTMLYEVEATDPVSVIAVIGLLASAAALAAWLPARRAMRVDPVSLLRDS